MNGARTAPIPLAHIQAELLAFPLASESALRLGITGLDPQLGEETAILWRDAERHLVRASPSVSLDELVGMRDSLWFRNCDHPDTLGAFLEHTARRFLTVQGVVAVPRLEETIGQGQLGECSARSAWRWLSVALPPDLLLAALGDGGRIPSTVDAISPALARRLVDGGVAEPHLHLNASFDFARLWVTTLRGLAEARIEEGAFRSPGAHLTEGAHFASWLLRAAMTRYVLAGFLTRFPTHRSEDFSAYIGGEARSRLGDLQEGPGAAHLLVVLDELYRGRLPSLTEYAALRSLYRLMVDERGHSMPRDLDGLWTWDPIYPLLGGGGGEGGTPEVRFVRAGLRHIRANSTDRAFAGLFWQVVRIRCLFYRHLVQRPMTPGLQWFVRFFKRLKPARTGISTAVTLNMAALSSGEGRGLRSLEVRVSPDGSVSDLYETVRDLNDTARPWPPRSARDLEFGIVLHLARDRGGQWFDGKPTARWRDSNADPTISERPGGNVTGYRYGGFYRSARKDASAAARVLCDWPGYLEVVRALDLCTDEAGVPSWVMAPLLRYIRDAGRLASVALYESGGERLAPPPLRTTVHAGEDFVHLMSGLRRLDEALDHLGLAEGDRLGHALSLGVEPRPWAERAGQVAIPLEERLFDLAWEWSWYSRQGGLALGGRDMLLQREIAERSEYMFGEALFPWEMSTLVTDLHDERMLRYVGFPDGRPAWDLEYEDKLANSPSLPSSVRPDQRKRRRRETLLRYLTSPEVFSRGREIHWFDAATDASAMEHLQGAVRKKVGRMGLTIEVNPSSNLLIGHLGELSHHPLWRLAGVSTADSVPPLSICIGSDDPLTFATTLLEEYQLLYDALMQTGCSEATAHTWLDKARQAGMSSRFTLQQSAQPATKYRFRYRASRSYEPALPP